MTHTQFAHTIGDKYDETLDVTDIAKLVRADIAAAVADGRLPRLATKKNPDGIRISVRTERFSMGQAINVTVTLRPGEPSRVPATDPRSGSYIDFLAGGFADYYEIPEHTMTSETIAIGDTIDKILAAYNFDDSNSMTDYSFVNYYANVSFQTAV